MAHISEKEAGCHQRDSSPNIQTPRSGKSKLEPVTMSKLMEAFTTCDDTHREVVTYGCTVCYVLICDDCYLKQRSIGYRCSSKGRYNLGNHRRSMYDYPPFCYLKLFCFALFLPFLPSLTHRSQI